MALSWIFSGKKKEDKPVPVTVEAVEVGTDEGYSIIQSNRIQIGRLAEWQAPPSPYPNNPYIPLPYSTVPQRENQQPTSANSHGYTRMTSVHSQLEGIPFVLNSALENSSKQTYLAGLEDLRRAVFQIAADINDSTYSYNFKTEHNIMQEASIYNNN